jgi:hypothetical protein
MNEKLLGKICDANITSWDTVDIFESVLGDINKIDQKDITIGQWYMITSRIYAKMGFNVDDDDFKHMLCESAAIYHMINNYDEYGLSKRKAEKRFNQFSDKMEAFLETKLEDF